MYIYFPFKIKTTYVLIVNSHLNMSSWWKHYTEGTIQIRLCPKRNETNYRKIILLPICPNTFNILQNGILEHQYNGSSILNIYYLYPASKTWSQSSYRCRESWSEKCEVGKYSIYSGWKFPHFQQHMSIFIIMKIQCLQSQDRNAFCFSLYRFFSSDRTPTSKILHSPFAGIVLTLTYNS